MSIGLGEMELMSNHAEMLAGAPIPAPPAGRGRGTGARADGAAATSGPAPVTWQCHSVECHARAPGACRQLLRLRRPAGRAAVDAR